MSWQTIQNDFVRVGPDLPCPVCGKSDGCVVHKSGAYAVCYHVQSEKLWKIGYVHELNGLTDNVRKALSVPYKALSPVNRDWDALNAVFVATITDKQTEQLATNLNVATNSIRDLSVGWSSTHQAYTIPVRNEKCQIVGIQTRTLNGQKKMIRGSQAGVFMKGLYTGNHTTALFRNTGVTFIVEGASDTATALTINLNVVGRFNAVSCADILTHLLANGTCYVVADNSGPEIHGATQLVYDLRPHTKSCHLITLPFCVKDLREAVKAYGHNAVLNYLYKQVQSCEAI